jgi:putative flippase GtrA
MELSQALTTYSSVLPQIVYLVGPEGSPWWVDLLKTLVATFVGAGLAFITNYYFQRRQRLSDQRTAGSRNV